MSSSALFVSVVLIAAFAASRGRPGHAQPATIRMVSWRATVSATPTHLLLATETPPEPTDSEPSSGFVSRRDRPWWMQVGFGTRPPEPPVVGPGAQVQWWERARSLVILAALVLVLGLVLAGLIGALVGIGGYLLEQTAS